MSKTILLGHGSGGKLTGDLIKNTFLKHFNNPVLSALTDSATIKVRDELIAFTTDSYVVDPVFFPGGDIGKLAICGTVNDLAVAGADPKFISVAFIIEEAKREGIKKLIGEFMRTKKNAPAKDFYKNNKFELIDKVDGQEIWSFDISKNKYKCPKFIKVKLGGFK